MDGTIEERKKSSSSSPETEHLNPIPHLICRDGHENQLDQVKLNGEEEEGGGGERTKSPPAAGFSPRTKEEHSRGATTDTPHYLSFGIQDIDSSTNMEPVTPAQHKKPGNKPVHVQSLDIGEGIIKETAIPEQQQVGKEAPPQQKPKKKKHRPKVVKEGQSQKKSTPSPVTPKPAAARPKRKYVRRNGKDNKTTEKSCRRKLDFEAESQEQEDDGTTSGKIKITIEKKTNLAGEIYNSVRLVSSKVPKNRQDFITAASGINDQSDKKALDPLVQNKQQERGKCHIIFSNKTHDKHGNTNQNGTSNGRGHKRMHYLTKTTSTVKAEVPYLQHEYLSIFKKRKRTQRVRNTAASSKHLQVGNKTIFPMFHNVKVDEVADMLKGLNINEEKQAHNLQDDKQKKLVVYQQRNVKTPQRPKVNLDEETNRVWKLLLEDINNAGIDGEENVQNNWEDERRVFKGRADSFIARMHLVQGDRRFSPWKGSVMDSVAGVFLTQNVSDHLSSSAFMSLAARFPLNSNGPKTEETIPIVQEPDNEAPIKCHEKELNPSSSCNERIESCLHENPNADRLFIPMPDMKHQDSISGKPDSGSNLRKSNTMKGRPGKGKQKEINDWGILRKEAQRERKEERSSSTMDSLDWEAVRRADVKEIAYTIRERGMNNRLAERIQNFLNRVIEEQGNIDLEWLRDVPPDKAKEYLLSIRGLGLKSVECVRLLTLHHLAFPVDTNVGRIAVRLGWVPLQPLPESLQLHLLQQYPILESIQRYLWPRLCKLDQRTLYELHYQMITFGKVFCTKSKPNCNACPLRGECRHFASAFSSARFSLPASEEKGLASRTGNEVPDQFPVEDIQLIQLLQEEPQNDTSELLQEEPQNDSSEPHVELPEPIVEVPFTPESELTEIDIEDSFCDGPEEIPTIRLNVEEFTQNIQNFIQQNMELQDSNMSKALVALTAEAASIPIPKLKNVSQLRTEHLVYELPDSHCLLDGMDRREPDDPSPYLLAIWTPGETPNSIQPSERRCKSQEVGTLCNEMTCFTCNSIREANTQTVRGTLLIPCRTAMQGSFPLNGTYFQVNEVFADHDSSLSPIIIPRDLIWNLPRRTVYFGTTISTIFKGLTTESIQQCFWRGFVCVRGFDKKTRAPRPLIARMHFPASKLSRTKGKTDQDE
ncbi:DNA glycosylase/AP lyase ROS1-like isoform X2 [Impatiens glandulifera]|uniref:DNA glycosylase/AP lyase ROS1-like isoform X2 n=1 Tax=Impatiens glandulifera TaxID=253017 RepID=UPI001FB0758D|nr:DNA glycosylase/AP lyase ROS1-like isoform X2 [Impatiens glandulifera]